jgi:hypothetical protein
MGTKSVMNRATAYRQLVKAGLAQGFTVSVWDGGDWQVKRSVKQKDIFAAITSVHEAELRFRDADGKVCGWALIIPGLAPEETVADCSDRPWMLAAIGLD